MSEHPIERVRASVLGALGEVDAVMAPRLNVIIGENGAGKSHLLALAYAATAALHHGEPLATSPSAPALSGAFTSACFTGHCSVPAMGQDSDATPLRLVTEPRPPSTTGGPIWEAMATPDQAVCSPLGTAFETGPVTSARARDAIERAKHSALLQRLASQVVMAQAVRALRDDGGTVREIADQLRLSRSDVGRELKYGPCRLAGIDPADAATVAAAVEAAWC